MIQHSIMIGFWFSWMAFAIHLSAAEVSDPQVAIESAQSALRSRWDFDWYNHSTDELARIDVRPPANTNWLDDWFDSWEWWPDWNLANLFATTGWICIAIILASIAYLLIRAYLESEQGSELGRDNIDPLAAAEARARVESLPIDIRNPDANFLEEAQRYYREGNLAEAIIYLFSYQLVELDRLHFLRLSKGKTNRQYIHEVKKHTQAESLSSLASHLQQTMQLFEDSFFGGHHPKRAAFARCWENLDDFKNLIDQKAETTS